MARKAKKKATKKAKKAVKKTAAKKTTKKKVAKKAAAKRAPARKAKKAPARKASAKKSVRKTTAKKAARKTAKPDTDVKGEGNYSASRRFRESEEKFIGNNRKRIPGFARNAADALKGREGEELEAAEAETRARGEGMDVETQ